MIEATGRAASDVGVSACNDPRRGYEGPLARCASRAVVALLVRGATLHAPGLNPCCPSLVWTFFGGYRSDRKPLPGAHT